MNANRPYIICHMVTSIDGKVTGDFLSRPECEKATDIYYELNRSYKSNGFICGRVTMESSFTNGWYPDLSKYEPVKHTMDYISDNMSGFYAIAFDPKGKLGWKSNRIIDEDPGYRNAQIIEVLTKQASPRYLGYLEDMDIPYIFAGEKEIDVELALFKLKNIIGIEKAGWHAVKSEFVEAPLFDELPMALECKLISYDEESCRLVGEIINVCADERILGEDGKIDLTKFSPITYDPVHHTYRKLGDVVGKAFSDGLKLK